MIFLKSKILYYIINIYKYLFFIRIPENEMNEFQKFQKQKNAEDSKI
jgi:hypothetical protein